jgi:aspartyl-tRNA(Asn)/glutamyl-tRNA(Gln) amidotransferase subunit A
MRPIAALAANLAAGRTTSRALVESALDKIASPSGEGSRVFLKTYAASARATAEVIDRARSLGLAPSAYAGIPVSVKDLFDVVGDVTLGGSKVLADAAPAAADAPAVARLRAAGLVIVGRTNMTEFAYSGVGLNPHYGTPHNPYDRAAARIPGGSSSGAAISVTDGMATVGLGTDTGGSCRIPAALTGAVGFKPTASRIPREGVLPLSTSLDSVGCIAPTVGCCAIVDAILAATPLRVPLAFPLEGLRLAVPQSLVLDDLDDAVGAAFARGLSRLSAAGARIVDLPLRELLELSEINVKGGFAAAEAYAWHRALLVKRAGEYDPRVSVRIMKGAEQTAADYIDLISARADFIRRVDALCAPFDALVLPTVPTIAPTIAELADDRSYARINLLMLRNPAVANFLDACAISLPCHEPGTAPVGLMLVGRRGTDERLLAIALAVEQRLGCLTRESMHGEGGACFWPASHFLAKRDRLT